MKNESSKSQFLNVNDMKKVKIDTSCTKMGFSASCELLSGWVVAFSGTFSDFKQYVQDSIDFYLECAKADGENYDTIFDEDYELEFVMDIQSILYCYGSILSRAGLSRLTGINQRQLGHYICGVSKPRKAQSEKIVNALHSLGQELQSISI